MEQNLVQELKTIISGMNSVNQRYLCEYSFSSKLRWYGGYSVTISISSMMFTTDITQLLEWVNRNHLSCVIKNIEGYAALVIA